MNSYGIYFNKFIEKELDTFFSKEELEQIAKESLFTVRKRKIASLKSEAPTSNLQVISAITCLTSRIALVRDPYAGVVWEGPVSDGRPYPDI